MNLQSEDMEAMMFLLDADVGTDWYICEDKARNFFCWQGGERGLQGTETFFVLPPSSRSIPDDLIPRQRGQTQPALF